MPNTLRSRSEAKLTSRISDAGEAKFVLLTYCNLNIFLIYRETSENETEDNIVVATTAEDDADKHPTGAGSVDGEAVSVSQEPAVNRRITEREKREEEIAAKNHNVQEALAALEDGLFKSRRQCAEAFGIPESTLRRATPVMGAASPRVNIGLVTSKKMYLGGEELKEVEPGVSTRSRHSLTRQSVTKAKTRSVNAIIKHQMRSKQYCMFYNKFGKCTKRTSHQRSYEFPSQLQSHRRVSMTLMAI